MFAAFIRKCRVGVWKIVDCSVFKFLLVGGGGYGGWPIQEQDVAVADLFPQDRLFFPQC